MARIHLTPRLRGDILFGLVLVGYAIVAGRLLYVQGFQWRKFRNIADSYHVRSISIPAHRGVIKDRNGELLAINSDAGTISVDPSFYWDSDKWPIKKEGRMRRRVEPNKDLAALELSKATGIDASIIRPKLDRRTKYVMIQRHVPIDKIDAIDRKKAPGLQVDDEPKRMYPMGSLAAQVLGYTNLAGEGQDGMEARLDKALSRRDGVQRQEVDRLGRPIPGTLISTRAPVDGANVVLTLDSRIQQVAERELNKACSFYRAAGGTCIVLEPNTGEILAMANYPPYDPNQPGKYKSDAWRNRAVVDLYEPGSTMKGITASAAVNEHVVSLTERFSCPQSLRIGAHTVHDVTHGTGSFGMLTLEGILEHSSNVGMSQVGLRLGAAKLQHYVEQFGLLDRSGVDMRGEPPSWLPPLKNWDHHFTATVAFGQSVNFTALRLVSAYGVIANGGTLMKPHIVKRIEWPQDGKSPARVEETKPQAVRRVITQETARTVAGLLKSVVADGTGKPAKIRGYTLVGKTGSAQKAVPVLVGQKPDPKHPGKMKPVYKMVYGTGRFIASFIGYLPKDHPRAVILVTVDEPKGTHWGATAAAPVFREVARQTMWYMDVPPDDPTDRIDGSDPSTWNRAGAKRTASAL
ncbi:MAG TPA: penicillin-binding protein 2 [Armatimonadota bacterium]